MKNAFQILAAVVVVGGVIGIFQSRLCTPILSTCNTSKPPETQQQKITDHYYIYSEQSVSQALAEQKRVVLYFHAPWCTTCSSFDEELRTAPATLPKDLMVFQIDYDSATELKRKYAVTYQHTLVLLDQTGETQEIWIGGDLPSLLSYL